MKNTINSHSGNTAQLQKAADGYPFQFPHFTETVWIKHPKPAHLSYDQMEEYAYKSLESSANQSPLENACDVSATLNKLPIGVSMGDDSIVVKISFKDYTDEECTALDNFRELHDEIHTVLRLAIDDLGDRGSQKNPNYVYTVYIAALLPALVPTGISYAVKKREVANA